MVTESVFVWSDRGHVPSSYVIMFISYILCMYVLDINDLSIYLYVLGSSEGALFVMNATGLGHVC